MEKKICIKCKELKELDFFWKNGEAGYKSTCVSCMSIKRKNNKKYYSVDINLLDKSCSKCKKHQLICNFNKDKTRPDGYAKQCNSCRSTKNKSLYSYKSDIIKRKNSEYYYNNKPVIINKQKKKQKDRTKTDHVYAMTRRLRNRLWYALNNKNWKKNTSFSEYIGCTYTELVTYLENKFKSGMTWDNRELWHIDHIIPLSSAKTDEEMYKLCHYTNLQPLWAKDNLSKGAKFEPLKG